METIEISIELLQEIQSELRKQRVTNMELYGQLSTIRRLLQAAEIHLPSEKEVEYVPSVISKINEAIQKSQKKLEVAAEQSKKTTKKP